MAFRAFHTDPPVDVRLTDLSAAVTNLTNVEDKLDPLIATVRARGSAMESGRFEFEMSLDPQSHRPNFKLAARLLGLDVTELTSLTRAYGGFEFSQGRFDLVVEADVKDGFLQGYAKPLFIDAKVLSESDLESGNPVEVLWEGLIGVTGEDLPEPEAGPVRDEHHAGGGTGRSADESAGDRGQRAAQRVYRGVPAAVRGADRAGGGSGRRGERG